MWTERILLDALWGRLTGRTAPGVGMPPRYVMAEQVRYSPAWGNSIADAIAVDTWGSGRYELEGYEVKCSRSDWRRELPTGTFIDPTKDYRDPERFTHDVPHVKNHAWRRHCTRWFILAPAGVVPRSELPDGWGLIEATAAQVGDGANLRCVVKSGKFDTEALPPMTIAGLMRATATTAQQHTRRTQ